MIGDEALLPTVTVIVPMRDEEADIAGCVAALAAQTYPREASDVVFVDGGSRDRTRDVLADAARTHGLAHRVIDNPACVIPAGLNTGLATARGSIVVRVDVRSRIGVDHVRRCVEVLTARPDVGVVGGAQRAIARTPDLRNRAIARALNNRWLTGLARYRRSCTSGAADTVWMGAFRTDDLRALGGWDEDRLLNEDYDLNERYRATGAVVWFDAALGAGYLPRASLAALARQYVRFGRFKADGWVQGRRVAPRHVVLLAAPPLALAGAATLAVSVGVVPVFAGGVAAVVLADVAGGAGAAGPLERAGALAVNALVAASWWWGVTTGLAASRAGRRPHAAVAQTTAR